MEKDMIQKDIFIDEAASVKDALKKLDKTAEKVLLVVDAEKRLLGTITDGDIRRYILDGNGLESNIKEVYNNKPIYIKRRDFLIDKIKNIFIKNKIELLPILDKDGRVIDFTTWSEIFSDSETPVSMKSKINIPVVIMAGGKGTRLDPFSKIFPKPLIPIGDKAIIQIIIDEFRKQGGTEYYLTLNHKGDMIKSYFDSVKKDYKIEYVWEKYFLGTAGALKLLEKKISSLFIVSNCDVLVKANFEEVINFHKEHEAFLTILSSIQHYKIPYGVIKIKKDGIVVEISEKPEYTFTINTGVYILNKKSLRFISKKSYFDMTDLIKSLITNNKRVVMYPVNEKDYIDIGGWEEYKKAIEKLQVLK